MKSKFFRLFGMEKPDYNVFGGEKLTESIQAALDSKSVGWGVMVSQAEDNFIADLSVGLASGQHGWLSCQADASPSKNLE
ncbi:hypothetical protein L1987_38744 [Smallanthus sonchifolius]|uniref:Uncharacterized protein n=1 Tax=Smallanthus sonchifolius TaxID=185202 RepID=A0ACB9HL96_9ASTR|nr:hypothetical protein L1987_38744 [Smallanthus sonchifolius]